MRHRHDRHVHARERADLPRIHPARVDDDVRLDGAAVGLDSGDTTAVDRDRGDARRRRHFRAAPARSLGQCERQLARVDVSVGREESRAMHAVGRHRREELLRLGGRDQLERQAERLRPAGLARDLLHPLGRRREPERPDLVPAGLEADLRLERAVEIDALHHHLRERERAAKLPDEARGVERRATRELGPLDEHDVVPAEPGEPVQDRAAPDAASDHHRPGPVAHAREPSYPRAIGSPLARSFRSRRSLKPTASRSGRGSRSQPANSEKFLRRTPLIGHVLCRRFLSAPSTGRR